VPGFSLRYHQLTKQKSTAIFGQATYKLTDQLSLTAGSRYSHEKTTANQLTGSVFGLAFPTEHQSASKPSWTFSLDYQVTPSLMVYVAQRGSWRAGSYNYSVVSIHSTAAAGGNRFGPETIRDVEVEIFG